MDGSPGGVATRIEVTLVGPKEALSNGDAAIQAVPGETITVSIERKPMKTRRRGVSTTAPGALLSVEVSPHRANELVQITEAIPHHIFDDLNLDVVIPVNQNVAESRHIGKASREAVGNHAGAGEELKQRSIGLRLAKAFVGGEVRGDVESGLDGDLEGVLHETLLADIDAKAVNRRQGSELMQTRDDAREFFRDQIAIGHRSTASR